jgi:hypothetical protein
MMTRRAESKDDVGPPNRGDASSKAMTVVAAPVAAATVTSPGGTNSFSSYFDLVKKVEDEAEEERKVRRCSEAM